MIDAYAHPLLPRFMAPEAYLALLAEQGISAGVAATAESCPDLGTLADLAAAEPERLRAVGLQRGATPAAIAEACAAQIDAGMCGIRMPAAVIATSPAALQAIGERGGLLFPHGDLNSITTTLVQWLNQYPDSAVLAQHFAGAPSPEHCRGALAALLGHDRCLVIASRHSAYDQTELLASITALRELVPVSRWLWGSEYPVCLWRDETLADTQTWLQRNGWAMTDADQQAMFHDNAQRVLFDRRWTVRQALPTALRAIDERVDVPVWLLPPSGLEISEASWARLMQRYLDSGGDRQHGGLAAFLSGELTALNNHAQT